jgi:hypothetical protein
VAHEVRVASFFEECKRLMGHLPKLSLWTSLLAFLVAISAVLQACDDALADYKPQGGDPPSGGTSTSGMHPF